MAFATTEAERPVGGRDRLCATFCAVALHNALARAASQPLLDVDAASDAEAADRMEALLGDATVAMAAGAATVERAKAFASAFRFHINGAVAHAIRAVRTDVSCLCRLSGRYLSGHHQAHPAEGCHHEARRPRGRISFVRSVSWGRPIAAVRPAEHPIAAVRLVGASDRRCSSRGASDRPSHGASDSRDSSRGASDRRCSSRGASDRRASSRPVVASNGVASQAEHHAHDATCHLHHANCAHDADDAEGHPAGAAARRESPRPAAEAPEDEKWNVVRDMLKVGDGL